MAIIQLDNSVYYYICGYAPPMRRSLRPRDIAQRDLGKNQEGDRIVTAKAKVGTQVSRKA